MTSPIVQSDVVRSIGGDSEGDGDVAELVQKLGRTWRGVASITLVVIGLAATAAFGATVTQAPSIAGEPTTGSELTASTGAWTPTRATPAYDWLRCDAEGAQCVAIARACGRRYRIRIADEGQTLRARLTVTEANGQAASASSLQTALIVPKPYSIPADEDPDTCTEVTPTGPGQGTFSSGAQTGAGTVPSPGTSLAFIDPFPVIRIAGRFKGARTTLRRVTVRAPRGARIQIRCRGRGCPYRRKATAVKLVRVRSLQRTYRPRATIEIRVTQPQKIGKYTRVRTRKGKAPVRIDRCLRPGRTRPVRCPTA
jgi:hypothetical protein